MQIINVKTSRNNYNIYIEPGLLGKLGELLPKIHRGSKIAIITDTNVAPYYFETPASQLSEKYTVTKILVPAGEASKRLHMAEQICDSLSAARFSRSDLIVALGGGVIGDLAGFVAATYLRGVDFVQVPTSLLAQVDSSIGGKVAVDIASGKNLVGAFYPPQAVYIDPLVLHTLPEIFFYDGLAEVIKYACIKDAALFAMLSELHSRTVIQDNIGRIVQTCLEIKKNYVELDEFDTGERMFLNFGHTIGHALEKHFNFTGYTHGQAVAIGMNTLTQAAEHLGLTQSGTAAQLRDLLQQYQLPQSLPEHTPEFKRALLAAMAVDKKNLDKQLNLILIEQIGRSFIYKTTAEDMKKFID